MSIKSLEFYEKNNIVPTMRTDESRKIYADKRKKLYRQLGVPKLCFAGSEAVEFGPSSGENALVLLEWGNVKTIDLVEPNQLACKMIETLYDQRGINKDKYKLYPFLMEEYKTEKKYDIIIAEQFIQNLNNWENYLDCMDRIARQNSIIITTCSDTIGLYIERMKRLVAQFIISDVDTYEEQMEILLDYFESSLTRFKGMNRRNEDYISDTFLNKWFISCNRVMNMMDIIDYYKDRYDVLGASQNIFTDHSWFKDLSYDYISAYKEQYAMKRHMFLVAGETKETLRTVEENSMLAKAVEDAADLATEFENTRSLDIEHFGKIITEVSICAQNDVIREFNRQFIEILQIVQDKKKPDLNDYKVWINTFGKSSQYISLVKK